MNPYLDLNLNLLRIYAAVGEHLHISRAADSLKISQPAVSKSIRELETRIGITLLHRGNRAISLTEAGQNLLRHARTILSIKTLAEEELRLHLGLEKGRLRVGVSTTVSMYYLPKFIAAFHERHPGVEIEITTANTQKIANALADYQYDLALVEGPVRQENLLVRRWCEDELVLITSSRHPSAKASSLTLADLQNQNWVVREKGSGTEKVVDHALRSKGVDYHSAMRVDSTEAILNVVEASRKLCAFVSRKALENRLAGGKLIAISIRGFRIIRSLSFLSCRGRTLSPAAQAFSLLLKA